MSASFASASGPEVLPRIFAAQNYSQLHAVRFDDLAEIARSGRADLALDAAQNQLKIGELRTALAAESEYGLSLTRNQALDGSDWLAGVPPRTYDALGPFPRFNEQWGPSTIPAFDQHLRDYDFVIVDVAGLDSRQLDVVFAFIDSKPPGDQAKVLLVESVSG